MLLAPFTHYGARDIHVIDKFLLEKFQTAGIEASSYLAVSAVAAEVRCLSSWTFVINVIFVIPKRLKCVAFADLYVASNKRACPCNFKGKRSRDRIMGKSDEKFLAIHAVVCLRLHLLVEKSFSFECRRVFLVVD